jgi:hypothetical protein
MRPYFENTHHTKGWQSGSGEGPKFKTSQYDKKKLLKDYE